MEENREWQICGHNGAALFASVGDDLKQQFRLVPVEAEIAQLIQNQQIRLGQRPFQFAQMVVVLGFTQFRRKRCRILKQDIVSLGAGFQTQSNRQMGLAPAGVSNHNDILPVLDKLAAGQLLQEQRRNRIIELTVVEFLHRFEVWKSSRFQPPPVLVFLPGCCFRFHEFQQQVRKSSRWICLPQNFLVFCKGRDLQLFCIETDQFIYSIHRTQTETGRQACSHGGQSAHPAHGDARRLAVHP